MNGRPRARVRVQVRVVAVLAAGALLMTGCSEQPKPDAATSAPSAEPTASHPPTITLSDEERAACDTEPTRTRVDTALAASNISASNSQLALPQEMDTIEQAEGQSKAWAKLSDDDRAFQLCLNDRTGTFGNTPTLSTCDSQLSEAALADLASSNLRPRTFALQDWDYDVLGTINRDGVVCSWGNSGDVRFVLGKTVLDDAAWEQTRAGLLSDGFVQEQVGGFDFYNGPDREDADYPTRGVIHHNGVLIYLSSGQHYADLVALSGP